MEVVIDVPERIIVAIANNEYCGILDDTLYKALKNFTPLPKGHGKLIDVNEITAFRELECNGYDVESLDEFTTIIEADKEE